MLLASSCRQRILKALSKIRQSHMMNLVRKVNSTYSQVNRNLQILQREGIVKSEYYGRIRIIRLNRDNPKTEALLKALKILERAGNYELSKRDAIFLFRGESKE